MERNPHPYPTAHTHWPGGIQIYALAPKTEATVASILYTQLNNYPSISEWGRAAGRHWGPGDSLTGSSQSLLTLGQFTELLVSICGSQVFLNGWWAGSSSEFHYDISHKWEDFGEDSFKRKFKLKKYWNPSFGHTSSFGVKILGTSFNPPALFGVGLQHGRLSSPWGKVGPCEESTPSSWAYWDLYTTTPRMPIWGPV